MRLIFAMADVHAGQRTAALAKAAAASPDRLGLDTTVLRDLDAADARRRTLG